MGRFDGYFQAGNGVREGAGDAPVGAGEPAGGRFGDVVVMKFGGSVLRDESCLERVVGEIYREVRAGRRVVAVVSAFFGETNRLIERAKGVGAVVGDDPSEENSHSPAMGSLLASGETVTAALLGVALDRAGLACRVADARGVGMVGEGPRLDANPVGLDVAAFGRLLDEAPVVVLPGFGLVDEDGGPMLLGRGGSDLSAVFVADRLGAELLLIKDVDGLYEHDPAAESERPPRRYVSVRLDEALSFGSKVLQPKALEWAMAARGGDGLGFVMRSVGSVTGGTRIGHEATRLEQPPAVAPRPVRVAIAGLGTVGRGVLAQLNADPAFEVVAGLVRSVAKHADAGIPVLTDDAERFLDVEADVVVELMGGVSEEPGGAAWLIRGALGRGRHVVSANKAAVASDLAEGASLGRLAEKRGLRFLYSAGVGGCCPAIEAAERLSPSEVHAVRGVLNGTCNFVIGRMAAGVGYDEAVIEAQEAGFAEADPSLDVDGSDAAQKLAVLVWHGFGEMLDWSRFERQGIEGLSPEWISDSAGRGQAVRLVAQAVRTPEGLACRVAPEEVPLDSVFGRLENEWNAAVVSGEDGQEIVAVGKGAGRWPTAESVVADLRSISPARVGAGRG